MSNNDDASIIMQEQRKRNHDEYTIQGVLQDDDTALASPLDALSSSTTTVQLSSACAPLEVAGEEEEGGEGVSEEEKGGKEEEDGGDCRIGSTDAKSISLEVSAEGEEKEEEEGDSKEEEEEDGECRIGTIETTSIPLTSAESTAISIKEDVEATFTKEELAAREEEDLSDLPEPEYDYLDFTDLEEDFTNEECSINRQHAMFQEDTVPPSFTECHGLYQNEEGDMDEGDVSSCNNNATAAAAARDGDDNDVKVSLTASLSQHEESFARNDKDDYAGTNLEMSPPMTTAAMEQITTHHEHESKQQDTMETYSQLPPSFSQHDDCKPKADHYPPPKDEEEEEEDYSFTSYILGTLVVKVIAARNLKPIERGGLGQLLFGSHHHRNNRRHRSGIGGGGGGSNPYAKIIFDNQSQRTDIMYDTVNPIWPREEQSYFDVVLPIPDLVQEEEEEDGQEIKMKRDKLGYIMEEKSGGYCSRKKGVGKEKRVDNDDGIMASVPLVSDPVLTIVIFHSVGGGNDDSKKKDPNKKANANDDDNDISLGFTSVNIRHLLTGKVTIIDEWFPLSDNGTNSDDDDDSDDIYSYSAGEVRLLCEYEPTDPPPRTGDLCRITGFCCPTDLYPVPAHLLFRVDEMDGDDIILSYKTEEEGWHCTFVVHRFSVICAKRHQAAIERYREGLVDAANKLVHSPLVKVVAETVKERMPEDGVLFVGADIVLGGFGLIGRWAKGGIGTALDDVVNVTNWDGRHTPRLLDNEDENVQIEINNAGMSDEENEEDTADYRADIYQDELDGLQDMNNGNAMEELSSSTTTSLSSLTAVATTTTLPCCPITGQPMKDPVVAADGHTYERHAIRRWLQTSDMSPLTGQTLSHKELVPNYLLLSSTVLGGDR
uniref:U-box domain-containing protein n=1 Tax=Ditylum brightwellii TaxID=49249 RepID=A0A7S4UT27_9STRA